MSKKIEEFSGIEVTMPIEVAQAGLDAMKKVFLDWDVLQEQQPEFLKHMQDLAFYVESCQ